MSSLFVISFDHEIKSSIESIVEIKMKFGKFFHYYTTFNLALLLTVIFASLGKWNLIPVYNTKSYSYPTFH